MGSGSEPTPRRVGKYGCFAELARAEVQDRDYRVRVLARDSSVLIVAPHGGLIEDGTSQLAEAIAQDDHNLFAFEGLKSVGSNRDLHITSHLFDHPQCLALAARSTLVLGVHGCRGDSCIHVGGLDRGFVHALASELAGAGFRVEADSRRYPGTHPRNICNRGPSGAGAQLELTYDLRQARLTAPIAAAVRTAIARRLISATEARGG